MAWFLFGLLLLAALIFAGKWFVNADPKTLAKLIRYSGVGLLGLLVVVLLMTGRFWLLLMAAPFLIGLWRRGRVGTLGMPSWMRGSGKRGQVSETKTDYLHMILDHDSGIMSGTVMKGRYNGCELADLSREQLLSLLHECHIEDLDSYRILEAYLDRTAGPEWREQHGDQTTGAGDAEQDAAPKSAMSPEEAYEILGLQVGASAAEIKEAYRRLMQKMHPDQGGSTYLASKINQAKDLLLNIR